VFGSCFVFADRGARSEAFEGAPEADLDAATRDHYHRAPQVCRLLALFKTGVE